MLKTVNHRLGYTPPQGCYIQVHDKYCNIEEIATREIYNYIIAKWKSKTAAGKIKWIEK
jgi:hypothetical protein